MIDNYLKDVANTNSEDIKELERLIKRPLPEMFRVWISQHGGADVRPELPIPDETGNALLSVFLSVDQIISSHGAKGSFSETVPANFIVVGEGPGGAVCLRVDNSEFGSVWFADYDLAGETLAEGERYMSIMSKIADNWEEFLKSR